MAFPAQRFVLAACVGALLAAPAVADATTSHTSVWETKTVICGIEAPSLNRTEVLCQAAGVPRPPHGPGEGDPGILIAARGKPQLILMSEDEYPENATTKTLSSGTVWSARGVTCTIGRTSVTCRNRSGHGFVIGNGRYKPF